MNFKRIGLLLMGLVAACGPIPDVGNSSGNSQADEALMGNDVTNVDAGAGGNASSATQGWQYENKTDQMRGSTSKIASVDALQTLSLAFPYGDTIPTLNIRQDPKFGFDIYLTSKGQPLCRSYENETVSVKFDNGPVQEWRCNEAADGSAGVVFFQNARNLLGKIKSSEKMAVEVNYYDNGRQQFTFPVKGLDWK
jgi:hypothetical protein